MNDLSIRPATEQDIPAILTLYRDAGIEGEIGFTVDEAIAQFAVLNTYPYFKLFVAMVGERMAGTYELVILDNMAKRGRRSGLVEAVAVHPQHQGQDIGRAMMHHALEQCSLADCYKMALSSNLKREQAHLFYDSLGFTRHGYSFQIELPGS
jgi:GNAT superfamily N-acetyltransferase